MTESVLDAQKFAFSHKLLGTWEFGSKTGTCLQLPHLKASDALGPQKVSKAKPGEFLDGSKGQTQWGQFRKDLLSCVCMCVVTLLVVGIKCPQGGNSWVERFIWDYHCREYSPPWWGRRRGRQEHRPSPTVRKQKGMSAGTQLTSFITRVGSQAVEWNHSHSGWDFPPPFI